MTVCTKKSCVWRVSCGGGHAVCFLRSCPWRANVSGRRPRSRPADHGTQAVWAALARLR